MIRNIEMILVIGDSIIDEYLEGSSSRLAPEAPVPVILNPQKVTRLGGANNVFENLLALGPNAEFISDSTNISKKTRIVSNGGIVARIDNEQYVPFRPKVDFTQYKYVILSDYNKGALHYAADLVKEANNAGCKVFVDPKKPLGNYQGAFVVKLNKEEYKAATGIPWAYEAGPARRLCKLYNIEHLIVTLGEDGVFLYSSQPTESMSHLYGIQTKSLDVTGAGDVFMAALVHYYSKGLTLEHSLEYANKFAALSVAHFGTYTLTEEDVDSVENDNKIIFTNGVFDVLHKGHLQLLEKSKALGGKLIVGINSDESAKRLKGESRPINTAEVRKAMLKANKHVDEVYVFDEDTPYNLIKQLNPDILTKGGDYKPEDVVGNDLVKVVIIPYVDGYSTTEFLKKLQVAV